MKFHGALELAGKTATGIEVPPEVVSWLGGNKRPKVTVGINGYTYRSSIASMGGRFMLPVSAEVREGAGVRAGDELEIDVELDDRPRTVTVPADLVQALDDGEVRAQFDALSYSVQLRHVLAVDGAKTTETRSRRIGKVVEELRR